MRVAVGSTGGLNEVCLIHLIYYSANLTNKPPYKGI
jgi:hypothetical protein